MCLPLLLSSLQACRCSVPNEPEAVAIAVVQSLVSGNVDDAKEFATEDLLRVIDSDDLQNIFNQAKMEKNMNVELEHTSDVSYDGTMKNVYFVMKKGDAVCHLRVTVVDDNGKWLFSNIQYK